MRVLLVVDSLAVGGAERHVVDLAVELCRRGHAVTVACSAPGMLLPELHAASVQVEVLGHHAVKRRLSLLFAWRLRALVRARHFDLIHTHGYASLLATVLAAPRALLVHTEHSEATWRGIASRWLYRVIYPRISRIIAVSHPIKQRLVAQDGVPPSRVHCIPNAVPTYDVALDSDLPPGRPRIAVVGRLRREKGIDVFLAAAALVLPHFPSACFLVVGDGPLRPGLVAHARALHLANRIHFLGWRTDARVVLSQLDVLVVPSRCEGAPLIVLEAMAAGAPIVASAVGGIPDQIRHDQEGLLVQPDNPAALARSICTLLRDPTLRQRCTAAARQRATQEFCHAELVDAVHAVYHAALC